MSDPGHAKVVIRYPGARAPTRFVIAWVHRDRASRSGDGVLVVRHVDLDRFSIGCPAELRKASN